MKFFKKDKAEEDQIGSMDAEPDPIPEEEFRPAFNEQPFPDLTQQNFSSSDFKLILAKLDLLNQKLEMIDKRLQIIEEIAKQ